MLRDCEEGREVINEEVEAYFSEIERAKKTIVVYTQDEEANE